MNCSSIGESHIDALERVYPDPDEVIGESLSLVFIDLNSPMFLILHTSSSLGDAIFCYSVTILYFDNI